MTEGEYTSTLAIDAVVQTLVPRLIGWGQYREGDLQVYYFLSDYHSMNFPREPEPIRFANTLANLRTRGKSPTGRFGFPVPTALGKFARTVRWHSIYKASHSPPHSPHFEISSHSNIFQNISTDGP
jgi:protein-ribulosamine 3-kinase